jgi:hypothetical protein
MYSAQGIFQHHFQCKKVRTILNKIWYIESRGTDSAKRTSLMCQLMEKGRMERGYAFSLEWEGLLLLGGDKQSVQSMNTNLRGRVSTVDTFIKVACYEKKKIALFSIKST